NGWWHLHWPRDEKIWESPKILSVQMGPRPQFVPAPNPCYVPFSANVFVPSPERKEHLNYFAGILNSKLFWKWFTHRAKRRGVGLEINGGVLAKAPIRTIDFSDPREKALHDELVALVDQMLEVQKE